MNSLKTCFLALFTLGMVLLAGCGDSASSSPEQRLSGTWNLNSERILAETPEEHQDNAQMMLGMMGEMTFTFDMDALTLRVDSPMSEPEEDSFEVVSSSSDELVLASASDPNQMRVIFHDNDTIQLTGEAVEDDLPFPMFLVRQ